MEKLMSRWSDPSRPNLLPKPGRVGQYSEIKSMPDFGKYNPTTLIEAADECDIQSKIRFDVECDAALWGTDPERCALLVKELTKKMA